VKIKYKLVLFALVCSVLPLLMLPLVAFESARSSLHELVKSDLLATAQQELNHVRGIVDDSFTDLGAWSQLSIMQDVLIDDEKGDLQKELIRLHDQYDVFSDLAVANTEGLVIASSGGKSRNFDLSQEIEFQVPANGGSYRGAIEWHASMKHYVITLAIPVIASYDESLVIGVLIGFVDWRFIESELSKRLVLGGSQGRNRLLIIHSGADHTILYPSQFQHLPNIHFDHILASERITEISDKGQKYLAATLLSEPEAGMDASHWVVHVLVSTDIAYESIFKLKDYLLIIGSLTLIMVSITAYFLSNNSIRRLTMLAKSAQSLASGNFDAPVPADGRDEIGVLSKSFISMRDAIQVNKTELTRLAYYDGLTSLPNRELFKSNLERMLELSKKHNRHMAVMYLDLDDFKGINDTLGHSKGDLLLKSVAGRLTKCVRASDGLGRVKSEGMLDSVSRLGGDEFTILLSEINNVEDAIQIAQRIIESLSKPCELDGHELVTTTSIGIAIYPNDGDSAEELIKNADAAMYTAKRAGKNLYVAHNESLGKSIMKRLKTDVALRRAMERDELSLHYQPQLNLHTNRYDSVEALIRWQSEELGTVSPSEFIPIAEETGVIVSIGEWVLQEACQQVVQWRQQGLEMPRVAVNISMLQFQRPNFPELIDSMLSTNNLEAQSLDLEITETLLAKDWKAAVDILEILKEIGVLLSIDDFGTGYSSLSQLKNFPIDRLKIDQSFTRGIDQSEDDEAIVLAIIGMARSMKLKVLAEGVETNTQRAFLHANHCDEAQGYLFSRPKLPEEIFRFLNEQINEVHQFHYQDKVTRFK